ncbi:hypothetical protein SDC9_156438 [bioreactor metagenome]|uniref:Uncharacterized protein n=1 Tax=bioreactor metagenome TaxID=1076179 RepID=A0A645F5K1_9ZZZZ
MNRPLVGFGVQAAGVGDQRVHCRGEVSAQPDIARVQIDVSVGAHRAARPELGLDLLVEELLGIV